MDGEEKRGNGDMKRLLVGRKLLMMPDVDRFLGAEDWLGWIWEVRSRLRLPLVLGGGGERECMCVEDEGSCVFGLDQSINQSIKCKVGKGKSCSGSFRSLTQTGGGGERRVLCPAWEILGRRQRKEGWVGGWMVGLLLRWVGWGVFHSPSVPCRVKG